MQTPVALKTLTLFAALTTFVSSTQTVQAAEIPKKLIVATWNVEWFYDNDKSDNKGRLPKEMSAPTQQDWDWKLNAVADCIGKMKPTIIALQEVENKRVLDALVKRIKKRHSISYRVGFVQGRDTFTEQDVALLYQDGLVKIERRKQTKKMFDSGRYYNLSKHIIARFSWQSGKNAESLVLINTHFRAGPDRAPLRQRQARLARYWMEKAIQAGENVIILGDLNANNSHANLKRTGTIGVLCGLNDSEPANDLRDLHRFLPKNQRATHLTGKQFDRILASGALMQDDPKRKDFVFRAMRRPMELVIRDGVDKTHLDGVYKIPRDQRDSSDHYPLVAEFELK